MKIYEITPVPAPRMTQSDKWKKRPAVMRYFEFRDRVKELGITVKNGDVITFIIPMPESWSKKRRYQMFWQPHQIRGDIDNYAKAIFDSVFDDDSHIWDIHLRKIWGETGEIRIVSLTD